MRWTGTSQAGHLGSGLSHFRRKYSYSCPTPDISGMEIIVRDPSAGITRRRKPPKAKELQAWIQEQVAEDAVALYDDLKLALQHHLRPWKDDEGILHPPTVKVMELAADILNMRQPSGGGNINQNFGGNTTINNNNGIAVSFEDIVRKQQARESPTEIIDAEFTEPDANPDPTAAQG